VNQDYKDHYISRQHGNIAQKFGDEFHSPFVVEPANQGVGVRKMRRRVCHQPEIATNNLVISDE
jgi:hypothetical protein